MERQRNAPGSANIEWRTLVLEGIRRSPLSIVHAPTDVLASLDTTSVSPVRHLRNVRQSGGGGGGGVGGEAALGAEAKSIEDQLRNTGGQFDIEAITMQYPVVYEESMNTVWFRDLCS